MNAPEMEFWRMTLQLDLLAAEILEAPDKARYAVQAAVEMSNPPVTAGTGSHAQ